MKLKQMLAVIEEKRRLYAQAAENLRQLIALGEDDGESVEKKKTRVKRVALRKKRTLTPKQRKAISIRMKAIHAKKREGAAALVAERPTDEMTAH